MKHLLILLAILIPFASNLSAQCEDLTDNCPEDLSYNLKVGENDTMFVVTPPDTNQCGTSNLFYTINGPVGAAGNGAPEAFVFETGISELTYQYSESRFGNFSQNAFFLPDGTGVEYSVPFLVFGMGEGQTVGGAGGLARICFVMEHSYLGDLDLWVTCPDGSSANLHEYSTSDDVQRQLLGQGDQNTATPDPGGIYCWSVGASRTMTEYVEEFDVGSNQVMPTTIDYKPDQDLSRFDTCLITGTWTLNIRDNLANDNGSVSSVFIDFGTNLAPPCVQEVKINQGTTPVLSRNINQLPLRVFPNPVADNFTLAATTISAETGQLAVFAPTGELLIRKTVPLSPGENTFQLSSAEWPIGIYSVRITGGSSEGWVKVVKTI